ncbi:amino acid ABC transporter permease [Paenarthrobacter nitroguajacolicus]|uniref:amino acid ABC transporter permease n=1 Tax=Paenarthrobacter nitroguajacolicus TaxID=211146 RepID=UPI00248BF572|nr:amino acid ABC transporter permease [Paenarthrobacter nitroguajacolicus]
MNPTATATGHGRFTVVPARHPWRWVAGTAVAAVVILLVISALTNPRFGWDKVSLYFRDVAIVNGIGITLFLTVVCMALGVGLGVVLAVMQLSANPVVKASASAYVTIFRGTPVLVQLLFWFNLSALYPEITFGIPGVSLDANQLITPLAAAILGLGLNEAAYMSEIVRAGIQSIEQGQSEAAGALGMSRIQTLTRVVLPQAMRVIIPPTGNEFIGMLKTTSLVSVLAVPELLYSAQIIYSKNLQVVPLLLVASIWYIIITTVFSIGQGYLERRFSRGTSRTVPPTPVERLRKFFRVHSPLATGKGNAS